MEFEAIKPTHRGLAPRCNAGKDLVAGNPLVMTYLDGSGIHKGQAGAVALALLQVGRQRDDHGRSQFHEPVVADQTGEFVPAVHQDLFSVIGFEGAVVGLVEMNENRHDLTGGQPRPSNSLPGVLESAWFPTNGSEKLAGNHRHYRTA